MEEGIKIIYKELSYKLFGICIEVHKILGRFCRERQICDLIEILLKRDGYNFEREKDLSHYLEDQKIGGNRVDFFIENKILFDAKMKDYLTKDDYFQMKRYLEATNLKLGILVNFREKRIRMKRVLNPKAKE